MRYPMPCPFCGVEYKSCDDKYLVHYKCGTVLQILSEDRWAAFERGEVCIKEQRQQIGLAMTMQRLEEQDKVLQAPPTEYELLRDLLRELRALRSDLALRDQRPARSLWDIIRGRKS